MRYALVGVGRMGRAVDSEAARRGHHKVAEIDAATGPTLDSPEFDSAALARAELAFEFTTPAAAAANVIALLSRGVAVVCGTTGWEPDRRLDEAARAAGWGRCRRRTEFLGRRPAVRAARA